MSLYNTLQDDLKEALKNKNALKVSTLRMLKSAIQYASIEKKIETPDDDFLITIIQKQIKQRNDSIANYEKAGRLDLKEKEEAEVTILQTYMPKQLSDNELKAIVSTTITEIGASSKKTMGIVIKKVMEKVQGRADGKRVSTCVAQTLL